MGCKKNLSCVELIFDENFILLLSKSCSRYLLYSLVRMSLLGPQGFTEMFINTSTEGKSLLNLYDFVSGPSLVNMFPFLRVQLHNVLQVPSIFI